MQIRDTGVNSAPCEPINTRGISYNQAAMEALLGKPKVEQPNFVRVEIPEASLIYFDAKGGVGDIEEEEEDATLPGAVEEEEEEEEVVVEKEEEEEEEMELPSK